MKLTKAQQAVVDAMRDGWELSRSKSAYLHGAWLQQGGAGSGGANKTVSTATVDALLRLGVIEERYGFPAATYRLKEPTQ